MSDSGIHQTSTQATRRQGVEAVGLWRDASVASADGDVPVVALGRADPTAQSLAEGSAPADRAAPLHSQVESFFHGPAVAASADQRQSPGSGTASVQARHAGVTTSLDIGSHFAAVLDFAVGLGPQPELEPAVVESEPARRETVAAATPEPVALRMPPRGHGVSTTFESALGLGGGDSWYRPNERSAHRPAGSMPSNQPVHDRSKHV